MKALEEDPTIFQYDEIYDEMQEKKEEKKQAPTEKKVITKFKDYYTVGKCSQVWFANLISDISPAKIYKPTPQKRRTEKT